MFNPYAVRPIGSDRFLEHLKDIQTTSYYGTEFAFDLPILASGHVPWGKPNKKKMDGWEELCLAIIANAFIDYLEAYKEKTLILDQFGQTAGYWVWNSRCISLENTWFRKNPFLEYCFDCLLLNVCWEGVDEIERCIKRFHGYLRWARPSKKERGAIE